ncbi:AraC family transcriptional regulator [Marinobacter sp. JSM 1782161]|uniref:AraC family transcriptional regulator n=1 Tax=Marinobacter sp. JSM 1782161 TaxID=2685906 RepID=UPI0014026432|nr:AraC family transcriptional regulator [Marinobacter sp. JSM 1782161]
MLARALTGSNLFDQAHPEDVSAFVNAHIGQHRLDIRGRGHARSSLSYRDFAGLGLSLVCYGNEVRVYSPELEAIYHFQVITRGTCYWRLGDERLVLERGQAMMINPCEPIDLTYSEDCEKLIVKLPEVEIRQAAANMVGQQPARGVSFLSRPMDLRTCPGFVKLLEAVFADLEEDAGELLPLCGPYRDIILRKLIHVFPNSAVEAGRQPCASPALDRMLGYIQQHLKEGVSIEELSAVSNLSARSIYNLFARHFSTTPKCYIKQLRLQRLRDDLQYGRVRNVTEAALDYGFAHLGRFSSEYRKAFGELPSETRRLVQ